MLKTGDYDLWSMRMEQYLTHIDYALWEVFVNGDAPAAIVSTSTGAEGPIPPKIAEQKIEQKNEFKANNSTIHSWPFLTELTLLKFHRIKDSKTSSDSNQDQVLRGQQRTIEKPQDHFEATIGDIFVPQDLKVWIKPMIDNTGSTNEAVNTAHEVSTASPQGQASSSTYDDDTGVGFDSQINENELHDSHLNKSEVSKSTSDSSVNESKEHNNQVNDRYKAGEGYHAVPPPYTGNFMPPRPDLSFAGLDDSVVKSAVNESVTSVHEAETSASKTSKKSMEKPKYIRSSAPIIEDWESDSDDDCEIRSSIKQNKSSYAKINFVKSYENTRKSVIEQHTYRQAKNLRKSQSSRVDKRNWNGMMTQKLGDGFEFKKKACLVCGSLNYLIKDYKLFCLGTLSKT
ncbi:hypothetical protein Tco_0898021 [Tanacetum coccineum]